MFHSFGSTEVSFVICLFGKDIPICFNHTNATVSLWGVASPNVSHEDELRRLNDCLRHVPSLPNSSKLAASLRQLMVDVSIVQ